LSSYLILPVVFFLALLPACASPGIPYARIDRTIQDGNPAEGVAILEKSQSAYGSKSEVLYLMDKGMIEHVARLYPDSNQALSKAEALTEDLYTARIHTEVEAFLTSDNALPYEGEDFEKVLLNVFMALNYAQSGQWDDALVEARKVDHKLTVLADRNQNRMTYTQDALARYLSGILYEATGDLNNALVSYRQTYDAFQLYRKAYGTATPDLLRQDLLRVSEALGLTQEHEEYVRDFPGIAWQPAASSQGMGEVVFITDAGRAPIKRDVFIDIPFSPAALNAVLAAKRYDRYSYSNEHRMAESMLYGLTGRVVRLAVPKFVPRPSQIAYTEAVMTTGDAKYTNRSVMMEDITAIAVKDLDDRLFRTMVKAVARAAWKYAMAEAVRAEVRGSVKDKETGAIAGAIAGAVAHFIAVETEKADTRSWATLPARIHVGRMKVPPGTYDLELRHIGLSGGVVETQMVRGVVVPERGVQFVSARVLQ